MGDAHRIGIVGLGAIASAYLETLVDCATITITAVADLDTARAERVAATLPHARAMNVAELMASDDVDTVLNLTIPAAHFDIAMAAIHHGKNVFGEKPLAVTLEEGQGIVEAAAEAGVRVGSAPDTVLGTGLQTARALIDSGVIGRPLAASATMVTPGHERWHPNPDFYYKVGGGPLLDMGPYYLSALVQLLGPVTSVVGAASRLRTERTIGTSGERLGERIPVEVATHVSGVLSHQNGVLSTLTTSFDGAVTTAAPIEVHGELGTLVVPDPNTFSGGVRMFALADGEWSTTESRAGYEDGARGVGLVDFVASTSEREPRASGTLALHSLDAMTGLLRSAESGERVALSTATDRPTPVPLTPVEEWKRGTR